MAYLHLISAVVNFWNTQCMDSQEKTMPLSFMPFVFQENVSSSLVSAKERTKY